MTAPLRIEAEEARRLLDAYGLDGEDRQISAESETSLPELIGQLVEADAADEAALEQCRARRAELSLRAERIEARRDQRREAIADVLATVGLKSLDCGVATVSRVSTPAALVITDEAAIPHAYLRVVTTEKPNRAAIKDALRAGKDVPGAAWSNARPSIQIRRV